MDHQTDYYNFQEFDRVWNRMKFGTMIEWKHPMEKLASDFSKASWKQVMSSLENIFPHHQDGNGPQWIDAFGTLNLNGNKPFQLKLAHECGLKIPEWTCITNRKESLKSFEMPSFHSSSPRYGMIMKTLSLCVAPPCNSMFTIPISYNQLSEKELSLSPMIFQHKIERRRDFRITIVGKGKQAKMFIAGIEIKKEEEGGGVDWRAYQHESERFTKIEENALDSKTRQCLLEYHDRSGLHFGAYDLIEDPHNGNVVFLECNPQGNWLWIDSLLNMGITEEIVNLLKGD
nr:unnamed protein product [Naegleria fowleri]